jgi:hypothetical protein
MAIRINGRSGFPSNAFHLDDGQTGGNAPQADGGFAALLTFWLGRSGDKGLSSLRRGRFTFLPTPALCEVPRHSACLHRVPLKFDPHSPAGEIKLKWAISWVSVENSSAGCKPESNQWEVETAS